MRQAVFIALGLALGIGLVITVTSAATGVQNAQAAVLHSLYGVGTGIGRTPQAAGLLGGDGEGHGIAGMRERAAIFGGTVDTGALPRGGFRVAAFLPVAPASAGRVA